MIDSHCHLHEAMNVRDLPALVNTLEEKNITCICTCACHPEDWKQLALLLDNWSSSTVLLQPSFGLHPWWINKNENALSSSKNTNDMLIKLKGYLHSYPHAGVGEIGLCKSKRGKETWKDQEDIFKIQLELGIELKRIITIHCVRAYGTVLHILQSHAPFVTPIILHGFSSSFDLLPSFLSLENVYFSIGPRQLISEKQIKLIRNIPVHRLLIETDASSTEEVPLKPLLRTLTDVFPQHPNIADIIHTNGCRVWSRK